MLAQLSSAWFRQHRWSGLHGNSLSFSPFPLVRWSVLRSAN